MRRQGFSHSQIARTLGTSNSTACKWVKAALERLNARILEKAEEVRTMELLRLDAMLLSMAPKIANGEEKAVTAALLIMERRAKLFGLDARQKQDVKVTMPEDLDSLQQLLPDRLNQMPS